MRAWSILLSVAVVWIAGCNALLGNEARQLAPDEPAPSENIQDGGEVIDETPMPQGGSGGEAGAEPSGGAGRRAAGGAGGRSAAGRGAAGYGGAGSGGRVSTGGRAGADAAGSPAAGGGGKGGMPAADGGIGGADRPSGGGGAPSEPPACSTPTSDGQPCGSSDAGRCCNGECVDSAADPLYCRACRAACPWPPAFQGGEDDRSDLNECVYVQICDYYEQYQVLAGTVCRTFQAGCSVDEAARQECLADADYVCGTPVQPFWICNKNSSDCKLLP